MLFLRSHEMKVVHPTRRRRPHRRRDIGMVGISFGGTWSSSSWSFVGKDISADIRDHTVELSVFWHVIKFRRSVPLTPSLLPFVSFRFLVSPPTALRGTRKEILQRIRVFDDCGNETAEIGRCLEPACMNVSADTRIPFESFHS